MKNRHHKLDDLIAAGIKAGENKDRIFLNIKKGGIQISAHELRHRINLVFNRVFYGSRGAR